LLGIPIAQKDIFCIEGSKTTAGSKILENFIAPYTATVVENMQTSGLISLGKTNMDEFAMGSSNENSYFGSVINPWSQANEQENRHLVPGGSSGGSAAAVAAQIAPAATGTDTGGSIRQPAAFCNLTGIKPSYGRCSRYGMIAFAAKDSTSLDVTAEDFGAHLDDSIEGLKIGLPKEFFSAGLDNEIATLIEEAVKQYEALGASVKEVMAYAMATAVRNTVIWSTCIPRPDLKPLAMK